MSEDKKHTPDYWHKLKASHYELLEVAKLVLNVDNAKSAHEHLRNLARAAIAKAEGN